MILINSYKLNFIFIILSNIFFLPTDTTGTVTRRRLTAKLAHALPPNEKIEVPYYNTTGQPTTDAAILFRRHCRLLGKDFRRFPIDPTSWRKVPRSRKEEAWEIIKVIRISKYYNTYIIVIILIIK